MRSEDFLPAGVPRLCSRRGSSRWDVVVARSLLLSAEVTREREVSGSQAFELILRTGDIFCVGTFSARCEAKRLLCADEFTLPEDGGILTGYNLAGTPPLEIFEAPEIQTSGVSRLNVVCVGLSSGSFVDEVRFSDWGEL